MRKQSSRSRLLGTAIVGALLGALGCEPTPDYKIIALHVPASASVLLVGFKGDSDTVSGTSLAVPVGQLSAEARQNFSIGLSLSDAPDPTGVLSIATVDQNGCVTSVVNAKEAARSSGGGVTTVEVELDGGANPDVVPLNPAYSDPMKCPRVPELAALPAQPMLVPTKPVLLNAVRELSGTAGVFDGGRIRLHGWGLDRGSVAVLVSSDPSKCFQDLAMLVQQSYPQYLPLFLTLWSFRYPALSLQSYAELDLQVAQIKSMVMPMPAPPLLLNGLIRCVAVSALSFSFTSQGGGTASFTEVLPTM